jgi:Cof subfamily protein (haloacid dehalogenase superfamily)
VDAGVSGTRPRFAVAAVDIDDTLVGPDGVVSAANAAALQRLVAAGTRVVLASGRSHANMLPFHRMLGLPPGPIISSQGAVVQDSETGEVRFAYAMAPDDVAAVTRDGRERGFAVQHYRPGGIHTESRTRWTEYDQTRNAEPHVEVPDLLAAGKGDTVPDDVMKMIWLGDPDAIAGVVAETQARHGARLAVLRTDPPYLEFTAAHVNKAMALAAVAESLGASRAEVVAFGDGNNDAAMLAWAGLGVAMPHAAPSARDAADHVGPEGDPETALARAVEMAVGARG